MTDDQIHLETARIVSVIIISHRALFNKGLVSALHFRETPQGAGPLIAAPAARGPSASLHPQQRQAGQPARSGAGDGSTDRRASPCPGRRIHRGSTGQRRGNGKGGHKHPHGRQHAAVITPVTVPALRAPKASVCLPLCTMKHALNQRRLPFISVGAGIQQELVQTCCLLSFNLLIFNEGWEH